MTGPGDWAPLVVAAGGFVSATVGAIVVLLNALRSRRIEEKVDSAGVVAGEIHKAVNGDRDKDRAKIASLEADVRRLSGPQNLSDH